jgi:hypothetical protein
MAQGDLRGTLTGSVNSVTNPMVASGSVSVSVGDLVFGTMSQQTNLTATGTVTDNLGNTYAYVNAGTDAGTVSIRSFYSRVTVAGTLTTVNVPASASTNDASVVVDVIEGPFLTSPLDANPANTSDATTPFTCPATGTLAQADEVVMAAIALAGNQTPAATSPSVIAGTVARANASTGQSRRVVSATSSVTPEFTNTNEFFSPTVEQPGGTQDLTPSLFTDGDTFFDPTVASTYPLTPELFSDGDTFFDPTVTSTYALAPSQFTDSDTFFSPEVTRGAVDLAAALFTDGDNFFSPNVAAGAVDLGPALFSNVNVFFSPTVVVAGGTQDLQPDLFSNGNTFFSPVVEQVAAMQPAPIGGLSPVVLNRLLLALAALKKRQEDEDEESEDLESSVAADNEFWLTV